MSELPLENSPNRAKLTNKDGPMSDGAGEGEALAILSATSKRRTSFETSQVVAGLTGGHPFLILGAEAPGVKSASKDPVPPLTEWAEAARA